MRLLPHPQISWLTTGHGVASFIETALNEKNGVGSICLLHASYYLRFFIFMDFKCKF